MIVAGGYGQPGGLIVTGGYGVSEVTPVEPPIPAGSVQATPEVGSSWKRIRRHRKW